MLQQQENHQLLKAPIKTHTYSSEQQNLKRFKMLRIVATHKYLGPKIENENQTRRDSKIPLINCSLTHLSLHTSFPRQDLKTSIVMKFMRSLQMNRLRPSVLMSLFHRVCLNVSMSHPVLAVLSDSAPAFCLRLTHTRL